MVVDETGQDPKSLPDDRLTSLHGRLKRAQQVEEERRPQIESMAGVR